MAADARLCALHAGCLFVSLQVISVEPPNFVELEVTDAPPGVKGNTASGECQAGQCGTG